MREDHDLEHLPAGLGSTSAEDLRRPVREPWNRRGHHPERRGKGSFSGTLFTLREAKLGKTKRPLLVLTLIGGKFRICRPLLGRDGPRDDLGDARPL